MIAIVTKDKEFSAALCGLIARELGVSCDARAPAEGAALLITDEAQQAAGGMKVLEISAPVRLRDLLSEVAARLASALPETILLGGYQLSLRQKTLSGAGKTAALTDKETQLLAAIAGAGEAGIGRERLLKDVWGMGEGVNTHTLETHIYRLRAKLKDLSGSEMISATESGYIIGMQA